MVIQNNFPHFHREIAPVNSKEILRPACQGQSWGGTVYLLGGV